MLVGPGLGDERRAGGPLAAHAEAEQDAEDREFDEAVREAAGRGEDCVDEDRGHQRAGASEAIRDEPEDQAAARLRRSA